MLMENRPFDRLRLGDSAEMTRRCTEEDLLIFAAATGNHNPRHVPGGEGRAEASGIYVAALISAVLGNQLPGPGSLYRAQNLLFHGQTVPGDELRARVTVTGLAKGEATLDTEVRRVADGALILTGVARVLAPAHAMEFDDAGLPGLTLQRHQHFAALLARAEPLPALITAVVCPEEAEALQGALLARAHSILDLVLIGDPARIAAVAAEIGADLTGIEVVAAATDVEAAALAVQMAREGRVQAIMKGHLHTDTFLHPMMDRATGLRRSGRLSHVFVMDVPGLPHPLLISDAAINIAPDLPTKVDIVQNAIDLAVALGIAVPKVAILSAVEVVNPAIPSSIDAALLSKMAERGQIRGGVVDGPLAMDNAIDLEAARGKGLAGGVAGRAEVLIVPDLDAGNMLVKLLTYLAGAQAAGVVMGARVPVILSSRSDSAMARLASAAVAAIQVHGG